MSFAKTPHISLTCKLFPSNTEKKKIAYSLLHLFLFVISGLLLYREKLATGFCGQGYQVVSYLDVFLAFE